MKITQLLQEDKVTLSLEVFPPKKDTAVEQVSQSVRAIAALHPDFMSVTYGAGAAPVHTLYSLHRKLRRNMMYHLWHT